MRADKGVREGWAGVATDEQVVRDRVAREDVGHEDGVALGGPLVGAVEVEANKHRAVR